MCYLCLKYIHRPSFICRTPICTKPDPFKYKHCCGRFVMVSVKIDKKVSSENAVNSNNQCVYMCLKYILRLSYICTPRICTKNQTFLSIKLSWKIYYNIGQNL